MPSTWRDQFRGSGDCKARGRAAPGRARAGLAGSMPVPGGELATHVHSHTSATMTTMMATRTTMNHLSARRAAAISSVVVLQGRV